VGSARCLEIAHCYLAFLLLHRQLRMMTQHRQLLGDVCIALFNAELSLSDSITYPVLL
jgi:hypothetical protein